MSAKRTQTPFVSADARLRSKCATALRHHRAWAAKDGRVLDYGIIELLTMAAAQQCAYCAAALHFGFQFDHRVPIARTPNAHTIANLCICCGDCNRAKGAMSGEEYALLLQLVNTRFDPRGRTDVMRRLKIAGDPRRWRAS